MTIGVDVGGTHIRIGTRTHIKEFDTPGADIPALIAEFMREHGGDAVGVGIPGTLDRDCRVVLNTPNIPALSGCKLADEIERAAGVPCFLENDTIMLMTGDLNRLEISPDGVILGVYIGTGLGSCVLIDGAPYCGVNGFGSELGHIPLYGKSRKCGCGNFGCAEAYVSGSYLQALRAEKYPATSIVDLFTVMDELDEYADALAVTVATAVQLFDPRVILIGGGVAAMRGFPLDKFKALLYTHTMKPLPAETLNVVTSASRPETIPAGVLGAIIHAESKLAALRT
ncbi:MAG: ROK family protein [Oscillospiraceae bacterium]|jgi:allose kinase|nr:ROK family protein [Oscillospiraceae bacterium]